MSGSRLRDLLFSLLAMLLEPRVYHIGDLLSEKVSAADLAAAVDEHAQLADKPGRHVAACLNRVAVRATFREHIAVDKLLAEMKAVLK